VQAETNVETYVRSPYEGGAKAKARFTICDLRFAISASRPGAR
jgi:hypothetical protein